MDAQPTVKLKIAQIVCVLPPYGGGIGRVAHVNAQSMSKRGHDVTVFAPREKFFRKEIKRRYKAEWLFPLIKYGHASVLPQLLWKLKGFDIIHLHHPFFGAAFFTALFKWLNKGKVKFVLTYHMDISSSGLLGTYYKWYKFFILPFVLRQADKILISSEDYIENSDISEYYFQNMQKFKELPFGAAKKFFPQPKDSELLKQYGFESDDKIVLFVGGLDKQHFFKGVNFLIKAFAAIPNPKIKCLIVGEGNLRKQYESQAKAMNLQERIKFSGYVDKKMLPVFYNLSDMFILPSINKAEAFGIVLVEAMACGKPLIASNLKGVRSVVVPGVNGFLIEPMNSSDIAQKINYLATDERLTKQFSEYGLRLVAEKFRWRKIMNDLEQFYCQLIERK